MIVIFFSTELSPCMFIHSKNTAKRSSWPGIHPVSSPSLQMVFTLPSAPQLLHLLCLFLQHFGRHCTSLSQSPVQLQSGQHGLCNTQYFPLLISHRCISRWHLLIPYYLSYLIYNNLSPFLSRPNLDSNILSRR